MTTATITKTIEKVKNQDAKFSLGFKRLVSLPARVRKSFALASNIETNWDGRKAHDNQVSFLESLNDSEFINWLKTA